MKSLVNAFNKGSSKNKMVMHLHRCTLMVLCSFYQHQNYSYLYALSQQQLNRYDVKEPGRTLSYDQSSGISDTNAAATFLIIHCVPIKIRLDFAIFLKHFKETIATIQTSASQLPTFLRTVLLGCTWLQLYLLILCSYTPSVICM